MPDAWHRKRYFLISVIAPKAQTVSPPQSVSQEGMSLVPETELGQVYKARADCGASSWVPQAYSGKRVLKRQKMVSACFIPSKSKQESLPHPPQPLSKIALGNKEIITAGHTF